MKKFVLHLVYFVAISSGLIGASGQTRPEPIKWDEGAVQPGCGEYGRIAWFMEEMMVRRKDARGLIIVFAGTGAERFGNLLGYLNGARGFVADHGVPASKISYVVAEGRAFGEEEYWIIPAGSQPPVFTEVRFDWKMLTSKYLFSTTCTTCEPSYPELGLGQPHYVGFAQVLRENPHHRGRIEVNSYKDAVEVRKELTGRLGLGRERYSIKISKRDTSAYADSNDLYIIPGTN
ncbi:MAG TPA: hypothetical protein VMZ26_13965 [Pyrinomonadaceae bacterium]|nr:hypothetical protein [Pyrinomonadaceae bacterium]